MKFDVTESVMRHGFSRFVLLFSVVSNCFRKILTELGGSPNSAVTLLNVGGHLWSGTVL